MSSLITAQASAAEAIPEALTDREQRKNDELARVTKNALDAIDRAQRKPMHISLIVSAFIAGLLAIEQVCLGQVFFKKNLSPCISFFYIIIQVSKIANSNCLNFNRNKQCQSKWRQCMQYIALA
jgi:hypothetical protein